MTSQRSNKAYMSKMDADLIEQVLLKRGQSATDRINVLEWGSGQSTLYYTWFLKEMGVSFKWVAIEHVRAFFYDFLYPQLPLPKELHVEVFFIESDQKAFHRPDNGRRTSHGPRQSLKLVVFDKGEIGSYRKEEDRLAKMADYITYPSTLNMRFDLVLLDGRMRRRCLLEAAKLMTDNGITFLHDAYRKYYHCAFEAFTYHKHIGDWLWFATHAKKCFDDLVGHKVGSKQLGENRAVKIKG